MDISCGDLWPLGDMSMSKKNRIFWRGDLDLWPWYKTCMLPRFIIIPNYEHYLKSNTSSSSGVDFFLVKNHVFQWGDLDLWPMTFKRELDMPYVHHHTKFADPTFNKRFSSYEFLSSKLFSSDFWYSDRQTAQVGSKSAGHEGPTIQQDCRPCSIGENVYFRHKLNWT